MAIRRITEADLPQIRNWWIAYRDAGGEFPGVDLDIEMLRTMISDAACFVLVDPATQTFAICHAPDMTGVIDRILTMTSGTVAARRAVDQMMKAICQGAVDLGLTLLWGDYIFPATFTNTTVESTRPIRYFNTLIPPGTKTKTTMPGGRIKVRYECAPAPLLAFITARTP